MSENEEINKGAINKINQNKSTMICIIANLISCVISFAISFFITPIITEKISEEAYGFISLGSNFINYASIATISINSLAGRYISVKLCEGNITDAKKFYSSVFLSNILMSVIIAIPVTFLIIFLQYVINISPEIVLSVKLLWTFLFANFFMSLISSSLNTSTFVKNRLDIGATRNIIGNILKVILLVIFFCILKPDVRYFGLAVFMVGIYLLIANIRIKKKLMPEVSLSRKDFSLKFVKILFFAGVWSSFSTLSAVLLEGMDLLIANLFIGSTAMGVLAVSKTLPNVLTIMVSSVESVFTPRFTEKYAKNQIDELVKDVKFSMKVLAFITILMLSIIVGYGISFYKLWVPKQNAELLYILTLLTLGHMLVTGTIKPLYGVFVTTAKLKINAISVFIQAALNLITVGLLLWLIPNEVLNNESAPWGLFIIAGVSSFYGFLRTLFFTPIHAADCLKVNRFTFYPTIIKSLILTFLISIISFIIGYIWKIDSWLMLIVACAVTCIIVVILCFLLLFNKSEKVSALKFIKSIFSKFKKTKNKK